MQQAIDLFHERHPDILLEIDVTRQPYSWAGDAADDDLQGRFVQFSNQKNDDGVSFQQEREARGNDDVEFIPLDVLGEQAGIKYKHGVEMVWQPVDSQRILLWAGRFGKQEEVADELGKLHFEEIRHNNDRETLLAAVDRCGLDVTSRGLDVTSAAEFLDVSRQSPPRTTT